MPKIITVLVSKNTKTGNIVQTYSSADTCPSSCPFDRAGCYAQSGRAAFTFNRTANDGLSPDEFPAFLQKHTARGEFIRHNVGGDIAMAGTDYVDLRLLSKLLEAYKGRRAYTYTHCPLNTANTAAIRHALANGFTVNKSCETLAQADKAVALGIPAVVVLNEYHKGMRTPDGHRVILCRNQVDPDRYICKSCQVCANAHRKAVVGFLVHGAGARKASIVIKELNEC